MLGGADNPNGELPSYITGANTEVNGGGVFQCEEQRMSLTCPYSGGKSGFGNGLRGHRRVTYQAVRTFNLSSGLR